MHFWIVVCSLHLLSGSSAINMAIISKALQNSQQFTAVSWSQDWIPTATILLGLPMLPFLWLSECVSAEKWEEIVCSDCSLQYTANSRKRRKQHSLNEKGTNSTYESVHVKSSPLSSVVSLSAFPVFASIFNSFTSHPCFQHQPTLTPWGTSFTPFQSHPFQQINSHNSD